MCVTDIHLCAMVDFLQQWPEFSNWDITLKFMWNGTGKVPYFHAIAEKLTSGGRVKV